MKKSEIKVIEKNVNDNINIKELLDQFKFVPGSKPKKKTFKGLSELGERLRRNQSKK